MARMEHISDKEETAQGDPDSGYGRYMGAGSISLCAGPSSSQIQRFKSNTKIQSTWLQSQIKV